MVATVVSFVELPFVVAVVTVFIVPFKSPENVVAVTEPAKVAFAPVSVNAKVWPDGLNRIAPVPVFDMSAKPFVEKFKSSSKVISPAKVALPLLFKISKARLLVPPYVK